MIRQRPPTKIMSNKSGAQDFSQVRRASMKTNGSAFKYAHFVILLIFLVTFVQCVFNSVLYSEKRTENALRGKDNGSHPIPQINSYDVLLKNTVNYEDLNVVSSTTKGLQEQINNLRSEIATLESKSRKYADDPRFFPFVIRDSRHLTPVQINPDFHVFDYVDLTQAKQPKSKHQQLLHNARIVVDEILEAKRSNGTAEVRKLSKRKNARYAEKHEAPCQKYSIECYRQKILQVFSYVLRKFPNVEYYFYVEADNNLCVPMTMVRDLALNEKRYFINTGIGFSGWIMSREFLGDFIELYGNSTLESYNETRAVVSRGNETETSPEIRPEIRPDVLASYYLTEKMAWTVTRQYWVSHTTLESLGIASLTVKDRRTEDTGERMKLDKHLPRCLEPRRGKWKVNRRHLYHDPRDRFGWDYFDYEICPNELLFPCGGQDQLKQLVEDDWKVANETGALAHWKSIAEKRRKKEEAGKQEKIELKTNIEAMTKKAAGKNEKEIKLQDAMRTNLKELSPPERDTNVRKRGRVREAFPHGRDPNKAPKSLK